MAKGVDKDWKCTTIFMSQELLQTKHDSVDYENEVIHNRRFYTSGARRECTLSGNVTEIWKPICLLNVWLLLLNRPGKLQQHCRKGSGPHRTVSSTDLLHGHFPAHSDHIRGSQYRLEEEALEEPSEKRNSKGTKVMDVLDKEKWENARGYGAQPKEESLGFVSEQEEEEDDSSLPRTGSQTTDSDNYKQGFHCLPKSLVPSEISHCLFEVEDTLRTLLTYLVEDESFSDQASSSSASLVSPTPTTPTPTKTPAVPTPAQPVPAPHPHFPFHLSTPHPSCHLGVHPPPKMHFHPHYETAHAVTRRPSETCRSQLIHPQPCFLDLPTELPSCGQRREEAGAFHILTKLRESVEQLLSIQKREYEVHKEVLALVRELGPLQSHNQSYGLSAQLQQVHHQASKITKLPLLCQRCQAGLPQI
ncbi:hypothetical protein P4O66_008564, partial [Electrophorus voltai]